jgi:hypothetical protein
LRPGASEGIRFNGGFISTADAPLFTPAALAIVRHPRPSGASPSPPPADRVLSCCQESPAP